MEKFHKYVYLHLTSAYRHSINAKFASTMFAKRRVTNRKKENLLLAFNSSGPIKTTVLLVGVYC